MARPACIVWEQGILSVQTSVYPSTLSPRSSARGCRQSHVLEAPVIYRFLACPAELCVVALALPESVLPAIHEARSKFCSCWAVLVVPEPKTPFFCISSNSSFISGSTKHVSVTASTRSVLLPLTVLHEFRHAEYETHGHNSHDDHGVLQERQWRDCSHISDSIRELVLGAYRQDLQPCLSW